MTKTRLETRLERLVSAPPTKTSPVVGSLVTPKSPKREPRVPAFKFGVLSFVGGKSAKCMVLDLSSKGARISLEGAINLPEAVRLSIPQHAIKIDAVVRWQRGAEAGLKFDSK
jgi:hypothetical protein